MPKKKSRNAVPISKQFSQHLDTNQLKPETKEDLKVVYLQFRKTLPPPTPCFSTVMFHLKRMKILGKAKNSTTILYYQKKGHRLVLAVDQGFAQRQQKRALAAANTSEEKDVDETEKQEEDEEEDCLSSVLKKKLLQKKNPLVEDKNDVRICSDLDKPHGVIDFGDMSLTESAQTAKITIYNTLNLPVQLKQFAILDHVSEFHLGNGGDGTCITIPGNAKHDISAAFKPSGLGQFKGVAVFLFERAEYPGPISFHIARFLTGQGTNEEVQSILPTEKYHRPAPFARVVDPEVEVVMGTPLLPPESKLRLTVPLNSYTIPFELRKSINKGEPNEDLLDLLDAPLSTENHREKFSTLLHIEELQMEVDIRNYDMTGVTLLPQRGDLVLKVPGLAENRPSLIKGDSLYVRLLNKDGEPQKKEYQGVVHQVGLNDVKLRFCSSFHSSLYVKGMKVDVRFTFTRTPLKLMHRALEFGFKMLDEEKLTSLQMRVGQHLDVLRDPEEPLRFFDVKLHDNPEQMQAVKNIVAGTSRPVPYLVFGPPGTGKTVTIVEATKQILYIFPESRVLVCAPSNGAADLLLERITEHNVVTKTQIVRLNAFGRNVSTLPAKLKPYCRISPSGDFFLPSKEEIMSKRLVVSTLITAGRLVSAGIPETHFTHAFIDEAGQSLEPEILVPLAGMFSTETPGGGQVVFAGDPQQLGPVLRSPLAIKHGLGMSLLERLMTRVSFYGRIPLDNEDEDEEDELGEYDSLLLTKLLKNYRSHPAILELPNEMFYDGELHVCANKLKRESLCNWERLPRKGFPVIFEGVKGRDMREEKSPSFFNPEEAAVVTEYVKSLKDARGINVRMEDIGVISPYRKQVQKISQLLQKAGISGVKVGSVEMFQGQERRVIIMSTVRSSHEFLELDAKFKLGFLKNPKRFNVAMTRAQALLIVVGNPYVLSKDDHWRRFIEFCRSNKAYRGCDFQLEEEDDELVRRFAQVHLDNNEAFDRLSEEVEWSRGEK